MSRISSLSLVMLLLCGPAFGATRVYYQDFEDTNAVEDFWTERNPDGKRVVGASDGAIVHQGNCLRGNWAMNVKDPITHLTTDTSDNSRYTLYDLYLDDKGISDSVFVDYWGFVDSNAPQESGLKWVWLQGHRGSNWTWNYIIQPPWDGWDTWWIHANNDQSDDGGYGRDTLLSKLDGIKALMRNAGETDVNKWFQGRWHHFQFYIRQNKPASARNGILKFWIDEVLVLNFANFHWRQNDDDSLYFFSTPHMYGGGSPPSSSFGWQIDEMQVWDGLPPSTSIKPKTKTGADHSFHARAFFDRNGRRIGSKPSAGVYFALGEEAGKSTTRALFASGNKR